MKLLVLVFLSALAGAQTPQPPQQKAENTPPKPGPALKLNLDEVDQARSRIVFEPREDKKAPVEASLPGMGAERARNWEPPAEKIYPADTNPNVR